MMQLYTMENNYSLICDPNVGTQGVEYISLTSVNDSNTIHETNTQQIHQEPADIATESTKKMLANILAEVRGHKKQIIRLTEEVITLRNEVRQFKLSYTGDMKTDLVPPLPLTNVNQLEDLHQELKDNQDIVVQMKYVIGKVGGACSNSFIRNAVKKILSDDVAAKFSWRGTINKPSIKEFNITDIIKDVCHAKFPNAEDVGINKVLQQHFVHAGDRLRKAELSKKKNLAEN